MKIYLMDQKYEILEKYDKALENLMPGIDKCFFTHLNELEKTIMDAPPNIVILDGDNGNLIFTVKKIKEFNKKIKIIVSSSNDNNALIAMQNNVNNYLKKPFIDDEIKRVLNSI